MIKFQGNNTSPKEVYKTICAQRSDIPVFAKDWWFETTSKDWSCAYYVHAGEIIAWLPYAITTKYGVTLISHANKSPYTYLGVNLPNELNAAKKNSLYFKVLYGLIQQLPKKSIQIINLSPEFNNHLPFMWKGYKQTTRYTYEFNKQEIQNFENYLHTKIKKSVEKNLPILKVTTTENISACFDVIKKSFDAKKIKSPHSLLETTRLFEKCKEKGCSTLLKATDKNGKIHAAIFLVEDKQSIYYLMGGSDPIHRKSDANTVLLYKAIEIARKKEKHFNFEGSINENIAKYFASFGATAKPYMQVKKINSLLYKAVL